MFGAEDANQYYDLMVRLTKRQDSLTWTELENMLPYEKDIYLDIFLKLLHEEENKGKMSNPMADINYTDFRDTENGD